VEENNIKKIQTKTQLFVIINNFLSNSAYSGLALFSAALIAMIWANTPWSSTYFDFWHTPVGLEIGSHIIDLELHQWVTDGLMAIFFFVIGLEIKRELIVGELSSKRKAAFPFIAAIGGMVMPFIFYILVNLQQNGQISGFGIPMATDIAFVLAFILILGKRVPLALKVFIVTTAVVDDLGAVILIASFYTESLNLAFIGFVGLIMVILILINRLGVKELMPYLLLGVVLWLFMEGSGIHATMAGVLLAFTIPVRSKISTKQFLNICSSAIIEVKKGESDRKNILLTPEQQDSLEYMSDSYHAVQSPLVRLEHRLLPFSSFIVMPVFALANAGIQISGISQPIFTPMSLGILLGLILGKPIGIIGATYIGYKLGWLRKPSSCNWKHIIGAGILGGVGFTMSMFITNLAFDNTDTIALAKLFIVVCSLIMGIAGVSYLWYISRDETTPEMEL
jgi:NhaA family Na+:H+ antiporter